MSKSQFLIFLYCNLSNKNFPDTVYFLLYINSLENQNGFKNIHNSQETYCKATLRTKRVIPDPIDRMHSKICS